MAAAQSRVVRIGCGAGFWGDSPDGSRQLVEAGGVDYLVLDYLAEITMSILARMRAKDPQTGYATDFVTHVMAPLAQQIVDKRIRVVANAGGVNPMACRDALAKAFEAAGVSLKIAVVLGDDLTGRAVELAEQGIREMFSGAALPAKVSSINAYLGAFPIAAALAAGADVVITGRCVDSALVLGPLIHEFGWRETDFDLLSAGSLAGHIIECGAQATGGITTDWRDVEAGWEDMAFPIAECAADGTFVVTKAAGHGGLVTPATIAEQVAYEVGDPRAYLLPDVQCDWSDVRLEAIGEDRVRVSGARGAAPPGSYKVSATYPDGWRVFTTMMLVGRDAAARAHRVGEAILARTGRMIAAADLASFSETSVEILGAETTFGAHSRSGATREVVLKIAARHPTREALEIFAREIFPSATAMAQSLTGFAGGRPSPQPVVRLFSFLINKGAVPIRVLGPDGAYIPVIARTFEAEVAPVSHADEANEAISGLLVSVPLIALAVGRSGDKGDSANVGVIARRPEFLPPIRAALTAEAVAAYFAHYVRGRVERFAWPGLNAFNFILHEALGGGGMASLRHDPQGKALAQALMDFQIPVPALWLEPDGVLAAYAGEVTPL
ncbi:MAG: terpene utilization protein AtuA [Rhizobiales bacterium PAR1]|nr:MAG: terpene utilization protein AtuA [Rhizobiales bacterium PAR1]